MKVKKLLKILNPETDIAFCASDDNITIYGRLEDLPYRSYMKLRNMTAKSLSISDDYSTALIKIELPAEGEL